MAVFRGTIRSSVLQMDTTVNVILPQSNYETPKAPPKTLILMHGLKQNADSWNRFSCVETYAHLAGFSVIMPEVQRSFYTDMAYGMNYFAYISEELPRVMGEMFRIPTDPEHLYAAGLSMGGYGAMKLALTYPDRFAGAMSFSGALMSLTEGESTSLFGTDEFKAILGMDLRCPDESDLCKLAEKAAAAPKKPRLYMACGSEDFLIEPNRAFAEKLRGLGFDLTYEEWPGIHDWPVWDRAVARGMAHMCGLAPWEINVPDTQDFGTL